MTKKNKIKYKYTILLLLLVLFYENTKLFAQIQTENTLVKNVGAMKNVMWKGELGGVINIDTTSSKKHLYGLGPVEYLAGEIVINDGVCYKSSVVNDTTMKVERTFDVKAPFFVYANVESWKEHTIPDSVSTVLQLERFLNDITKEKTSPFVFKISTIVKYAKIHIVNLPKGKTVSNPKEGHEGQIDFKIKNEKVDIIGFYSTKHQGIYTHHDTFLHMHLITEDYKKMGHIDEFLLDNSLHKLFISN